MPIANQVKFLTEDIEESFGTRIAAVSDIVKETHQTLGIFHRAHQKMAGDLNRSLAANSSGRVSEVRKLRTENTEQLKEMAKDLLNFLASGKSERKEEVGELLKEIRGFIRGVEKESIERADKVKDLLKSFAQEHQERAVSLRRELSSFQRNLSSVVKDMRAVNSSDHRQARTHWQNLAKIMAAKRAGKPVTAKKIEGVQKKEVVEAVGAFTAGNLKEQILRLISGAASGISLSQMGKALRIPYIRLAKPASNLLKEGKIKKEGSEYIKV